MSRLSLKRCAVVLLAVLLGVEAALAICKSKMVNPVTDVFWKCNFPIKIGGVTIISGPEEGATNAAEDKVDIPLCFCPLAGPPFFKVGIPVAFWEPARILESVKDPFCFPTVGMGLGGLSGGMLMGSNAGSSSSKERPRTAKQTHWYAFPVYSILELFTDFVCVEHSGFDVLYLTEIDPMWNDDILSFLIQPESLLFANPFAQLACTADSIASNLGYPLSPLFWCMGSWGSAYPLAGSVEEGAATEGSVTAGARMIFKLGRQAMLWDTALDMCFAVPSLIWVKHHWRLQLMRPKVGRQCIPIGRSEIFWGAAKNLPKPGADNFSIMIFRKRRCCAF